MAIRVCREDFDVSAEVRALTAGRVDIGAIVTFTGTVRGEAKGRPIVSMELEHYPGMTEAELQRVEAEALARWPLDASLIVHRYGLLRPGENIVLVVAASRHRQAAFEAAEFLMDFLKSRATFWKKETGVDGSSAWVDARESDTAALAKWGAPLPRTQADPRADQSRGAPHRESGDAGTTVPDAVRARTPQR